MKRSSDDIRRLVRVQKAVAAKAEAEHMRARRALAETERDIAELDAHAASTQVLTLLDLYVERTRQLAERRQELRQQTDHARNRHAGEQARLKPLQERAVSAHRAEERAREDKALGEILDRLAGGDRQASRKPEDR